MIAGVLDDGVTVPDAVARLAGQDPVRAVWRNELGGLTFEVGTGAKRRFVKWQPHGTMIDLPAEAERLCWARRFTRVPQVLFEGRDAEASWMVTAALDGESAVSDRWLADPAIAVTAIGRGLRALHDALPVSSCPFSWAVDERIARAMPPQRRDTAGWVTQHRHLTPDTARDRLADPPPVDRIVVCHGDACAPNTLIGVDGTWRAHVDLGSLGVADRWADLAVATWSTVWNYGPGWEDALLDAYGVAADPERTAYYRLLWDLSP